MLLEVLCQVFFFFLNPQLSEFLDLLLSWPEQWHECILSTQAGMKMALILAMNVCLVLHWMVMIVQKEAEGFINYSETSLFIWKYMWSYTECAAFTAYSRQPRSLKPLGLPVLPVS